ncbi:MAG: cysteine desulfurase family protein [Verrucomicrobiota bacterium]
MKKYLYFDHLATTPLDPVVKEAMVPFLDYKFANAGGMHSKALLAADAIVESREKVRQGIAAAKVEEILFCGSGSEAANLAIKGLAFSELFKRDKRKHLVISNIEHPAVLQSTLFLEQLGFEVTQVLVDSHGGIDLDSFSQALKEDTLLVSIHQGNFDLGTLQDISKMGTLAHECGAKVFCDAAFSFGWQQIDVTKLGVDLLSLSPHRFYGPKGVGILYVKEGLELQSLIHGGRQEFSKRAGTENVAAIVGAGYAVEQAIKKFSSISELRDKQTQLFELLKNRIEGVGLLGPLPGMNRLPHHLNLTFEGIEGEALMLLLDTRKVAVTSGTGCQTGSMKGSHVAQAIGITDELAKSSILIGLGIDVTSEDIEEFLERLEACVSKLRSMSPSWKSS